MIHHTSAHVTLPCGVFILEFRSTRMILKNECCDVSDLIRQHTTVHCYCSGPIIIPAAGLLDCNVCVCTLLYIHFCCKHCICNIESTIMFELYSEYYCYERKYGIEVF